MKIATFIDGPKRGEETAIDAWHGTLKFPVNSTDAPFYESIAGVIPEYMHLHIYEYRIERRVCKHEAEYRFAGVGHS